MTLRKFTENCSDLFYYLFIIELGTEGNRVMRMLDDSTAGRNELQKKAL